MVNWENAPDWAMWHAFDKDGAGWLYEYEPIVRGDVWVNPKRRGRINLSGVKEVGRFIWEASATKRPEKAYQDFTQATKKHSHYHKDVSSLNSIDVYRVLDLWDVKDHAIGHAIKKLLNAGQRGSKSLEQDLQEVIDSIQRKLNMIDEDNRD